MLARTLCFRDYYVILEHVEVMLKTLEILVLDGMLTSNEWRMGTCAVLLFTAVIVPSNFAKTSRCAACQMMTWTFDLDLSKRLRVTEYFITDLVAHLV